VLAVDQLDASDLSAPYLDAVAAGSGGRNFALLCRSCNADKTLDDDIPAQLIRHDRLPQEANLLEQECEALCRLAVAEALPGDRCRADLAALCRERARMQDEVSGLSLQASEHHAIHPTATSHHPSCGTSALEADEALDEDEDHQASTR
jgi:hypothetical protein